jgi:hypothetical protein
VPPTPAVDELRRESWPTIVAQTTSRLPATTTSSGPPQGGLLASLNARTSGGLLGGVAAPVEHFDSANYWGLDPTPLRTGAGPTPGIGYYLLPPAPTWASVPTSAQARAAQAFSEPASRSSWNVAGSNSDVGGRTNGGGEGDGIPQILSDITPDNDWIPGATYAGEAITSFREHSIRECRPRPGKCLIERPPDSCISAMTIGVMNMIAFTENTT